MAVLVTTWYVPAPFILGRQVEEADFFRQPLENIVMVLKLRIPDFGRLSNGVIPCSH